MPDRSLKKSQVIAPFGPGAIFDFGNESFVALDSTKWRTFACRQINLPRLEGILRVNHFLEPPIQTQRYAGQQVNTNWSVPYMRFPRWLFCPTCRRMRLWTYNDEESGKEPRCNQCGSRSKLAPMRFMAVCDNGHLTDVDWPRWAHSESRTRCENPQLIFQVHPERGGGLRSLSVKCTTCNSERNLEGITAPEALHRIGIRCPGKHPWQSHERAVNCDSRLRVVQRGDSNAYFPQVTSAIDIRINDQDALYDYDHIKATTHWATLQILYNGTKNPTPEDPLLAPIIQLIADQVNEDATTVYGALTGAPAIETDEKDEHDLLTNEWEILSNPRPVAENAPFRAEQSDLDLYGRTVPKQEENAWQLFRETINRLVLVKRLRIVNALAGFRRLDPSGTLTSPSLNVNTGWLPAVEIFGEGLFLSLDDDALRAWEQTVPGTYRNDFTRQHENAGLDFLPEPTPRFILLHTLAHLLIRQLSFECGYSASSLTERIYCDDSMAGILIYTASSDSEGALGGLVREGAPERFYSIFKTALFRGQWCSNDPICSEMSHQGIGGMNRAACHACTLIPETSCRYLNAELDRATIFGSSDGTVPGYFGKFMENLNY